MVYKEACKTSSTHNHTQKLTFARFKRMIDVDISDDAKVLLTKIGVETSLRYATNLITSAALACQKRKGKVVEMDDVSRVYELFWDVKSSTQYLIKYQSQTTTCGQRRNLRQHHSRKKNLVDAEAEAIHMILSRIGNDIYSTMDACPAAREMWRAIERLHQGESINIQDVKTKLFWKFGKFTSRVGESIKSYYTRVYIMMNEMARNKLKADTITKTLKTHAYSSSTKTQATTRKKGKEIVKRPSPPSESAYEEDTNEE
ncbi:retrovirus-related pol polyprotein from transposon TNT 1-94 [Tanacetum coccineum]